MTPLAGPPSVVDLSVGRRVVLLLACLVAYAVAAAVLHAMPAVFAPRPGSYAMTDFNGLSADQNVAFFWIFVVTVLGYGVVEFWQWWKRK